MLALSTAYSLISYYIYHTTTSPILSQLQIGFTSAINATLNKCIATISHIINQRNKVSSLLNLPTDIKFIIASADSKIWILFWLYCDDFNFQARRKDKIELYKKLFKRTRFIEHSGYIDYIIFDKLQFDCRCNYCRIVLCCCLECTTRYQFHSDRGGGALKYLIAMGEQDKLLTNYKSSISFTRYY